VVLVAAMPVMVTATASTPVRGTPPWPPTWMVIATNTCPAATTNLCHTIPAGGSRPGRVSATRTGVWGVPLSSPDPSPPTRPVPNQRDAQQLHHRALRALANRLVGILHGCLTLGAIYDEHTAGAHRQQNAA
jgi:hypothetical protein